MIKLFIVFFTFILGTNSALIALDANAIEVQAISFSKKQIKKKYKQYKNPEFDLTLLNKEGLQEALETFKETKHIAFEENIKRQWFGVTPLKVIFKDKNKAFLSVYTLYIDSKIKVYFWKAKQKINEGQLISIENLDKVQKYLYNGTKSFVSELDDIVGKQARLMISEGEVIREWKLSQQIIISKGKKIYVKRRDRGIEVQVKGVALQDGFKGKKISVRMPSGKIITGEVLDEKTIAFNP